MAEFRVEFKVEFGHSPASGSNLKGFKKTAKKNKPSHPSSEKKVTKPARRSARIELKEAAPDYVDKDDELIEKTPAVFSNLKSVEAINMNLFKSAEKDNKYKCDTCDASFAFRNSLQRHKNSQHASLCYNCSICGKAFVRKDSMKRHKDKFHFQGGFNVQYLCNLCSKTFDYKQNLVKHCNKFHSNEL